MLRTEQGIVIKRFPYSEANTGIRILTESGQILTLTAYGILSSKKRSNLISEPGSLISVTYYEHAHSTGALKEGNVVEDFEEIKKNYDSLLVLSYILELTDVSAKGEKNAGFYNLLYGALQEMKKTDIFERGFRMGKSGNSLDKSKNEDIFWLYAFLGFYKIRIVKLLGLLGDAGICANCGNPLGGRVKFAVPDVSFLCENCTDGTSASEASASGAQMAQWIRFAAVNRFQKYLSYLPSASETVMENLTEMDHYLNRTLEYFFSKILASKIQLYKYIGS